MPCVPPTGRPPLQRRERLGSRELCHGCPRRGSRRRLSSPYSRPGCRPVRARRHDGRVCQLGSLGLRRLCIFPCSELPRTIRTSRLQDLRHPSLLPFCQAERFPELPGIVHGGLRLYPGPAEGMDPRQARRPMCTNSVPKNMSSLLVDTFVGSQSPRKAPETTSSVTMISNILRFLDASPMTLFEGPPSEPSDRDRFYQENFESIIYCVLAPNETVRRLGAAVAKRVLTNEPVLSMLRTSNAFDSQDLNPRFWRLRCVFPPRNSSPPRPVIPLTERVPLCCRRCVTDLGLPGTTADLSRSTPTSNHGSCC